MPGDIWVDSAFPKSSVRLIRLLSYPGFHPEVKDLIWIGNGKTSYPVHYMVQNLWPALVRELGRPEITTPELEEHLVRYVELHRGIHDIPECLETFANRKRGVWWRKLMSM